MKVAITGASGFLGSKFIELYGDKCEIIALNSKNVPLNDIYKLTNMTKDVDVLVHAAIDHSYKDNITGIKNILMICKENNIKKLVHISTVSVYDLDVTGILNENSPYSSINDPYGKEKRNIEKEIEKHKNDNLDIIILQPTIIYGLGGNWTKYALHVCKANSISLPNNGNNICNAVYVDDVAQAIYKSCLSDNIKYEKILISSYEAINWKKFYDKQCEVLKELKLPSICNIVENKSQKEFHSNYIINFIFILWFKTSLGNIFDLAIGILKKIREKKYKNTKTTLELRELLKCDIDDNKLEPLGITKKVHSCKFTVDISKAQELLNYNPKFNYLDGINEVKNSIRKVLV